MAETPQLQAADVNLHDYLDIIRRRKWIIIQTFAVVAAIGLITTMMTTPIYRAIAKLKVEAAPLTITTQNAENPLASILSQSQPDSVETQIQMLQTEPFIQKVLQAAAVPVRADRPAPVIKVSNIDRTNVIVVQVESPSPQESARVAQTMLELHKHEAKENSTQGLSDAREFVTSESKKAKAALDRAEQQLEAFRSRNRVTELTAEQDSQVKNFIEMETQLLATRSNITRVKAEMQEIQTQLDEEPEQSEARVVNENPRLALLQNQLDDMKQRRVALVQQFQENNYRVRNMDAEIAALEARLKREPLEKKTIQRMPNSTRFDLRARAIGARAELRGLAASLSHLEAAVAQGRSIMNTMGHLPIRLARFNREREMAEAAYKSLEESRRELEIRYNARRDTAHIIEPAAVPRAPIRPRKALNLMFACMMGLCLGVSMAFLQEFLDDRVNSPEDVQRIVDAPVLGYIPMMSDADARLLTELPALSPIAESYRGLRSSISFAAVDKPLKSLVVSSSNQGEGKSLTSVNLAVAMAMGNRRVILVDADLRRPNVHRLMHLEPSPGLTDLLVGEARIADVLQQTAVEGLRVITSGRRPPNPAELLNSHPMEVLIQDLTTMPDVDVVIFDTPPCLPVTDAQVLATKVDGVLLVLEVGETRKAAVRDAQGLFKQARARMVGLIFNKIGQGGSQGFYYYYTSGSSYYTDELTEEHTNGKRDARRPRALTTGEGGTGRRGDGATGRGPGSAADDEL